MRENTVTSGDGRALFHFKPNLLPVPFKSFMPKDEPAREKPSSVWGNLPNRVERTGQGAVDSKIGENAWAVVLRDSTGHRSVPLCANRIRKA